MRVGHRPCDGWMTTLEPAAHGRVGTKRDGVTELPGRRTVSLMRTMLCLSAMLSALAFVPACGDDGGSASETSGPTNTAAGPAGSGSTAGSSTMPATSGTTPGTGTTGTTTPSGESTADLTTTGPATTDATANGTETSDASTGAPAAPPPPTDAATLLPWLEEGNYSKWEAEAARHVSAGPHFDGVRTFVNATLLQSLEAGGDDHPLGSAVVKELYGPGPEIGGWAVLVKVAPGSSVDNWYWYESFDGTEYAAGTGIDGCGSCHGRGVDFVRTTLPL